MKLGILVAGLSGAIGSTIAAGIEIMRKGLAEPTGLISEQFVESHALASFDEIIVRGWDLRTESMYDAALHSKVIGAHLLQSIQTELTGIKPWPAEANNVAAFIERHGLDSAVILNLLPTGENRSSQYYARLAAENSCPFVNFTPNDCGESSLRNVPYAGRDGKTGQTWLKSVLAPAFRGRDLRVRGWFSTNILGNEDGKVVSDKELGAIKIRDKKNLLPAILGYEPIHNVTIHYYPPRGDEKEGWDNIDFDGFLGMPMQIKVNQLLRDSILAAPMCIDLARFLSVAERRHERGPQDWLSMYFKAPYNETEHSFFVQEKKLLKYLSNY
jgi:myo-inositol-1-phosphate synthase